MTSDLDPATSAKARSRVFALLSLVYRQEPTKEFIEQCRQPELKSVLAECGIDLTNIGENEEAFAEELAIEYSDLFLVPKKQVHPYESVYSESGQEMLWGNETVDVKRFIETFGLSLEETDLLPDHVAVEMELLGRLKEKESEAWANGDNKKAREYLSAERRFLEDHLGRWFPQLADAIEGKAQLPFYRQVTNFARDFIQEELEEISKTV